MMHLQCTRGAIRRGAWSGTTSAATAASSASSASSGSSVAVSASACASASLFPASASAAASSAHRRAFHSSATRCIHAHQDHYKVLGITNRTASKADIKKQYYKLAKQYHPDTSGDSSKATSEQFTKIQSAWETLGDDKARKEYDNKSSSANSFTNSYANYAGNGAGMGGFGFASGFGFNPRPDEREYPFSAWSTRSGVNSRRTPPPSDFDDAWEFIDDETGMTEEELFADLFGSTGAGGISFEEYAQSMRNGAAGRKSRASAAGGASAKKKAASASGASGASSARKKQARADAERAEADEASANAANFAGRSSSKNSRTKRSAERRAVAGADLTLDVPLSFVEAAHGTTKTISFQADGGCRVCSGSGLRAGSAGECRSCNGRGVQNMRMPGYISMHVTCEKCDGSGIYESSCHTCNGSGLVKEKRTVEVSIPAGVDANTNIRLLHQGSAGRRGGANGHLLLRAQIAAHPVFTRQGYDLHVEHSLPLTTALLGGVAQVPALDGSVYSLRIEQGTQHMERRTIPGRGIRILDAAAAKAAAQAGNGGGASLRGGVAYGAQQVTFRVDLPRDLSPKAKDLLKQLALEMGNIHNVDLTSDMKKNSAQLRREREHAASMAAYMAAAAAKMEAAAGKAEATAAAGSDDAKATPADSGARSASTSTPAAAAASAADATATGAGAAAAAPASGAASSSSSSGPPRFTFAPKPPPSAGLSFSNSFASFAAAKRAAPSAAAVAKQAKAAAAAAKAAETTATESAAAAAAAAAAKSASPESDPSFIGPVAADAAAAPQPEPEPRPARAAAAAGATATASATTATAAAEAEGEGEVTDLTGAFLMDKRLKKKQKRLIKSKEAKSRGTVHIEPISATAQAIKSDQSNL